MSSLIETHCVACNRDSKPLTTAEIIQLKPNIPQWHLIEEDGIQRLQREFTFKDFAEALQFANAIGEIAEEEGHHPRLVVEWGRVIVTWWTVVIKALHMNDFIMATRVDDVASRWRLISGQKDVVEEASEESFPASDPPNY